MPLDGRCVDLAFHHREQSYLLGQGMELSLLAGGELDDARAAGVGDRRLEEINIGLGPGQKKTAPPALKAERGSRGGPLLHGR